VTYRSRDALPAGALIDVRLLDVTRADIAGVILARTEVVTSGEQVPVPFTLRYPPDAIQPGRRYAVQATIAVDGRVRWQTGPVHPVFAGDAATTSVAVVVEPVR
jgi:putative lipoprotein